jgi:glycerophosphoryl diester phosphodiesterase
VPTLAPQIIGHRGAPGYRPEHTRSSYELAFHMGVDAVEPDVVVTSDGVLVVRHENEVSTTTDVASRPEFAARRTTKRIDGHRVTGWFTEDFTWDELSRLRCRERLPTLRPGNTDYDGAEPILRLRDVLDLAAAAGGGVVVEIKHATYFAGLGWDLAQLVADELRRAGWADGIRPLVIESFESTVLGQVRERGIVAPSVYLIESRGRPADLVAARGASAPDFASVVTPAGLDALPAGIGGISLDKAMLLGRHGAGKRGGAEIVADAHERGLVVFTWTCRPENAFLSRTFRTREGDAAYGDYVGEWARLQGTGVDGVFVDHPDLGAAQFRRV